MSLYKKAEFAWTVTVAARRLYVGAGLIAGSGCQPDDYFNAVLIRMSFAAIIGFKVVRGAYAAMDVKAARC